MCFHEDRYKPFSHTACCMVNAGNTEKQLSHIERVDRYLGVVDGRAHRCQLNLHFKVFRTAWIWRTDDFYRMPLCTEKQARAAAYILRMPLCNVPRSRRAPPRILPLCTYREAGVRHRVYFNPECPLHSVFTTVQSSVDSSSFLS